MEKLLKIGIYFLILNLMFGMYVRIKKEKLKRVNFKKMI